MADWIPIDIIFGPDILETSRFNPGTITYIDDHIGQDDRQRSVSHLRRLHQRSPGLHIVEYLQHQQLPQEFVFLPLQPYYFTQALGQQRMPRLQMSKSTVFNFMINKPRYTRQWMVEHLAWRGLETTTYTLRQPAPLGHRPRYFDTPQGELPDGDPSRGYLNRMGTSTDLYRQYLAHWVFEPSCISLITEPDGLAPAAFPSEKTMMAFEGHTMPIWVGGAGMPRALQGLGFDVFEDVIDHSYQDHSDAHERMRLAIDLNQGLLASGLITRTQVPVGEFYLANLQRFQHNQELMRSGRWFQQHWYQEIQRRHLGDLQVESIEQQLILARNYEIRSSWPPETVDNPDPFAVQS